MNKGLKISVAVTVLTVVFCLLSDVLFNTQYLGKTYFQPFPHLILLLSIACDLLFLHGCRKEKRSHSVPPKQKSLLDDIILWCFLCLVMVTLSLTLDAIVHSIAK